MSTLALQQQQLLEALFAWPALEASQRLMEHAHGFGSQPGRGLKAYQTNGHMLAERALGAAFPVVAQMVGESSFADLARAFWHTHPPHRGDIAQWGDALAEFVRSSDQLKDEPYLADVARAEWALHRCAFAPNREASLDTLALLTTEDAHTLTLDLAPGLALITCPWPLVNLLRAHLEGSPSLAEVGMQMRDGVRQDLVVWRCAFKPQLRQVLPGELAVLQALQLGHNVGSALEADAALDIAQWLPLAVQTGLVLGVRHGILNIQDIKHATA